MVFLIVPYLDNEKSIAFTLPPSDTCGIRIARPQINLYLDSKNNLYLDNTCIKLENLHKVLPDLIKNKPRHVVSLFTEPGAKYHAFIDVLDQFEMAKVKGVSLAEPWDEIY
jgi:biopolymer transport protein ExbD